VEVASSRKRNRKVIGKKTTTFEIIGRRHPTDGALRTKTSFHLPTFGFLQTRLVLNKKFGLAAGAIVTFPALLGVNEWRVVGQTLRAVVTLSRMH